MYKKVFLYFIGSFFSVLIYLTSFISYVYAVTTVVNFTGFETGDTVEVGSGVGTQSFSTTTVRTGTYALRTNPTTTGVSWRRVNGLAATGVTSAYNSPTTYYTVYFRYATKPAANDEEILAFGGTGAEVKWTLRLDSDGHINAYDNNTALLDPGTGTTVLSANTWYLIEVQSGTGASGAYEVKINGTSEFSGTGNLGSPNNGTIFLGKHVNQNGNSVDFFYDDLAIDNTDYPGAGKVFIQKPTGDGTYTAWTGGTTGTYTDVDEVPHDSDTTYIGDSTSGNAETTAVQTGTQAGLIGTPKSVKALVVVKDEGGVSSVKLRFRSNTTDGTDTTAVDPGASYVLLAKIFNTDPATSDTWTIGGIDTLQVGVVNNASVAARATALYTMVWENGVVANATPGSPTSPTQLKNDASTTISNGGYATETNVRLRSSVIDSDTTEVLTLFFEAVQNADSFTSSATPTTGTSCASDTAYSSCSSKVWYVTSGSGNYSSTAYTGTVNVTGLTNGTGYKWQVKACDDSSACSAWVAFNVTTPNFTVDTTAPTAPGTPTTTSVTTDVMPTWNWTASSEAGSGLASTPYTGQWCTNSAFTGCDSNTTTSANLFYRHVAALANGTWYFRVKATDVAGNVSSWSSSNGQIAISATTSSNLNYGINDWYYTDTGMRLAQATGVGMMRLAGVNWALIQPTEGVDPVWNSSGNGGLNNIDSFMDQVSAYGMKVTVPIMLAPSWAYQSGLLLPDPTKYAAFVTAFLEHYQSRGQIDSISAVEMLAEETTNTWGGSSGGARNRDAYYYVSVLQAGYNAVQTFNATYNKNVLVATASLWSSPVGYLEDMYDYGAGGYFDVMNFHYYPGADPANNFSWIASHYRKVMEQNGDGAKPIWITEFGWSTTNENQSKTATPAQQSTYMEYVLNNARKSGYIQKIFWYTLEYQDGMALMHRTNQYVNANQPPLAADIDENDTTLTVSDATNDWSLRWPDTGTLIIDNEYITYTSLSNVDTTTTVSGLTRGVNGTAAVAHTTAATVYNQDLTTNFVRSSFSTLRSYIQTYPSWSNSDIATLSDIPAAAASSVTISNPNFETNTTGWTLNTTNPAGTLARSTSEYHSGVASASIGVGTTATFTRAYSGYVTLEPSKSYIVKGWVKIDPTSNANMDAMITLSEYDSGNNLLTGGGPSNYYIYTTNGVWREIHYPIKTTSTTAKGILFLTLNGSGAGSAHGTGTAYFDDITIEPYNLTVDVAAPSAPGTPSATSPTNASSQTWSWTAATDTISGIANYAWRVVDQSSNPIVNGTTSNLSVITNLAEGVWSFFIKAVDNAANQGSESTSSVTVDQTAPTISSVASTSSSNGVTIAWVTNGIASSKVDYGTTSSYGSSTTETDISPRVTNHSVNISGLVSCFTYHYRVRSTDAAANEQVGSDNTFTTTGCTGSAAVNSQSSSSIDTALGGSVNLLSGGTGLALTVPTSFAASNATFQIEQLDKTSVINTTSTPTDYSTIGSHVYNLKALTGVGTAVSTFDQPLTVSISYASSEIGDINENSLRIYHYEGTGWSVLSGCVVDAVAKTVTCSTTGFSVFALFGLSSSFSSTSSSSSSSGYSCDALPPSGHPDLFQINTTSDKATMFFSPPSSRYDRFYISYGLTDKAEGYGTELIQGPSDGVISQTINFLAPNTTYFFKIRGGNGCKPGDWSNIMKVKTGSQTQLSKRYYKNIITQIYSLFTQSSAANQNTVKSQLVLGSETSAPKQAVKNIKVRTQPVQYPKPKQCFLWIFCK